jgi:hypothetical protein
MLHRSRPGPSTQVFGRCILMATHRIAQEDAFAMLSTASQRVNRKLRPSIGKEKSTKT